MACTEEDVRKNVTYAMQNIERLELNIATAKDAIGRLSIELTANSTDFESLYILRKWLIDNADTTNNLSLFKIMDSLKEVVKERMITKVNTYPPT